MQKIELYKNGNSVGPVKGNAEEVHGYRLVADAGMVLSHGDAKAPVVDVAPADADAWEEIPDETPWTDEDYAKAGRILLGEGAESAENA